MNNNTETINILCATDNNYAPYCGIMLTSLFESNRKSTFEVYVLVDGIMSDVNEKKYKELEKKYGSSITLMTVDNQMLEKCPINQNSDIDNHSWVTKPTYYRLLAAELLPQSVRKVIYLDCDIVVDGDIRPLWATDLTGKAIAGIADCDGEGNCTRMGYSKQDGYFNAGVAVYNLEYWRNNNTTEAFFEFIKDNGSRLLLMDQDVVNGVLHDKKQWLSERFNFQVSFFDPLFWEGYSESYRDTIISECNRAVVLHYCGALKPWDFRYYGCPFYAAWNKYRKMSLWPKCKVTKPLNKYVKSLVKEFLSPKSLKRKRQAVWTVIPENEFCFE
jgi:lipopolysaccharide biosynthesis glycosyltransferase